MVMAKGRIPESDIQAIRERTPIEEIVGDYVQLKSAGADSLKGLSPFKDEKTPSFHVRPNRGYYHCFSTGKGGDVFSFLMEMEHISFPEAVEVCAEKIGYQINYQGGGPGRREEPGTRQRLILANKAAHQFYREQLETPEAQPGREFLLQRGFGQQHIYHFECGYAPAGWDTLTKHLLKKGFEFKELEAAGLSKMGKRGPIDQFQRRLLWPIKNLSGDVIGFGARKLFDDDKMGKYMNTPETLLYKKSKVLFGLDSAKKAIAAGHQAVVVEGYTDVMAMHAAGIDTAVASCGTAFGEEHLQMLRRLMLDDNYFRGELIYTSMVMRPARRPPCVPLRAIRSSQDNHLCLWHPTAWIRVICALSVAMRRCVILWHDASRCLSSSSNRSSANTPSTPWKAVWLRFVGQSPSWRIFAIRRCSLNTPACCLVGSAGLILQRCCVRFTRKHVAPSAIRSLCVQSVSINRSRIKACDPPCAA